MKDILTSLIAFFVALLFFRWLYHRWLRKHFWWDWYSNIYLKSWHWKLYRFLKILVYGRACQICHKINPKPLHVHHKHHKSLGHEKVFGHTDTILVCKNCHTIIHGRTF